MSDKAIAGKARTILNELPTLFLGCSFDAHWEYDCPCIVYSPVQLYGISGSSHGVDDLVDNYCCDLAAGRERKEFFTYSDLKEFAWRGWNPRGFSRRKDAWHFQIRVKWSMQGDEFTVVSFKERFGLKGPWKNDVDRIFA